MAKRTVCMCDGKYIGIESIFTVVDGKQINIPDKLVELRKKSQKNKLFCPCGCGSNMILVAGDRNLVEQHFRLKNGDSNDYCHAIIEGQTSIDSKIVLKCWLEEKLNVADIESRVQIQAIDDIERKYEFTFLSKEKKIAISYCYDRNNLSEEKLDILHSNSKDIEIIHITDIKNGGTNGQFPENIIKVQQHQNFCLLLQAKSALYKNAIMKAVFYATDVEGLWREIEISSGPLSAYSIAESGVMSFKNKPLMQLLEIKANEFNAQMTREMAIRAEVERLKEEQRAKEHAERVQARAMLEEVRKKIEERKAKEEAELQLRRKEVEELREKRKDDFLKNISERFTQQETQVLDADGCRWIKCEHCDRIMKAERFISYGGIGRINLGTCYDCSPKIKVEIPVSRQEIIKRREEEFRNNVQYLLSQQETPIYDEFSNRWIRCEICGRADKESEFISYGGKGRINLGVCKNCSLGTGATKQMSESTFEKKDNSKTDFQVCPECGGLLVKRNGKYGAFYGCGNFPHCRYTKKIWI